MTREPDEFETELVDLGNYSLEELRKRPHDDLSTLAATIIGQVERPRANLGSSGPPGRAD